MLDDIKTGLAAAVQLLHSIRDNLARYEHWQEEKRKEVEAKENRPDVTDWTVKSSE